VLIDTNVFKCQPNATPKKLTHSFTIIEGTKSALINNIQARSLIIKLFQLAYSDLGMIAQKRCDLLLMDQFTVNACPNNITSRTYDPLSQTGILTWILRTITEDAYLSIEMTRVVGAILSFW
jgi:hypothetical protein